MAVAGHGVIADPLQRFPGRGGYLCGPGCLAAAVRRKALGRAFRGKAPETDVLQLELALSRLSG